MLDQKNMLARYTLLIGLSAAFLLAAWPAQAQASSGSQGRGLFGSVEFKGESLKALPRWVRVLERIKQEQHLFDKCDADLTRCDSPAMVAWRAFVRDQRGKNVNTIIREVNMFANQWAYIKDQENWGQSDYWATPAEFLDNSGDCEDYVILKLVTLKELGIPPENMRLVVVQDTVRDIAHAVLAVYLAGQEPVILDSLFNAVLPHNKIMQYIPHYSVNETTRWAHIMPTNKK